MQTRSRTRRRRGGAAVEFALIMPVLMSLVLGCVDFGRFAYDYISITNAARAGAGFGAMNPNTPATYSRWVSDVQQAVANDVGARPGFTASSVTVTQTNDPGGLWRVRVTVPYQFKTVFYWKWMGIPSTINMQRAVEMRGIR